MAFEDVNCTLAFCPGKAVWFVGKEPSILRGGKGVRFRLGLLDGHEVMNGDANEKACLMVRGV